MNRFISFSSFLYFIFLLFFQIITLIINKIRGGHFAGHYDANYRASPLEQSFYTFMIYLNGDCGGGATNFLDESGNVIHSIKPKAGQALIFHHQIFHNGGRVESNLKYLMRSDAIYRSE